MNLDYYYGTEEMEQFSFFRMPKALMKNENFKKLSSDAKLLYTFMLDRMTLSMKKGWLDEENKVYIYYTIENIMEDLGCGSEKCNKILAELDSKKGIGLIEKKRQGLGKPDIIYVKNISAIELPEDKNNTSNIGTPVNVKPVLSQEFESTNLKVKTLGGVDLESLEFEDEMDNTQCKKDDSLSDEDVVYLCQLGVNLNTLIPESVESGKSKIQNFENQRTGTSKIENQEFRKSKINNTNINNTENNYTELNDINQSIYQSRLSEDGIDRIDGYKQLVRKNIEYDYLVQYSNYGDRELVEELYRLICDTICSTRATIRIAGSDMPHETVKAQFLRLNKSHIEYVLEELSKNTSKIHNIKAYLLTALYNAPMTINSYFQQRVRHDMSRSDAGGINSDFVGVTTEDVFFR